MRNRHRHHFSNNTHPWDILLHQAFHLPFIKPRFRDSLLQARTWRRGLSEPDLQCIWDWPSRHRRRRITFHNILILLLPMEMFPHRFVLAV
jgi:hypothetical protein